MADGVLIFLTAVLAFFTVLPISKRAVWWVRGADFPRLQFAAAGLVLLAVELALLDRSQPTTWFLLGTVVACLVYQGWWIGPYTRLFPKEVKSAAPGSTAERLRLMSANVLMTNRRTDDFLRIVRAASPDVLVTLETNAWWAEQLAPLHADYPHRLSCPLENLYGMHLYSRLPLEDAKIQFLVEPDIPSFHTLVVLPSGRRIRLHCVHPAPPSPSENETSEERDGELVAVGRAAADAKYPTIVAGDLNDVAWSATTRLFRKVSGLLDPRVGRGMFNTYHAKVVFCRWPLDHFFHSRVFTVVRLERLPAYGSDHFPVLLEVALDESVAEEQDSLDADASDLADAQEKMEQADVSSADVHRPGSR